MTDLQVFLSNFRTEPPPQCLPLGGISLVPFKQPSVSFNWAGIPQYLSTKFHSVSSPWGGYVPVSFNTPTPPYLSTERDNTCYIPPNKNSGSSTNTGDLRTTGDLLKCILNSEEVGWGASVPLLVPRLQFPRGVQAEERNLLWVPLSVGQNCRLKN